MGKCGLSVLGQMQRTEWADTQGLSRLPIGSGMERSRQHQMNHRNMMTSIARTLSTAHSLKLKI